MIDAIGWIASGVVLSMFVPQLVRMVASRSSQGVSAATWALNCVVSLAWLAYSLRHDITQGIVVNVVIAAGVFAVLAVTFAETGPWRARTAAAGAALAGAGAVFYVAPLGVLAVVCLCVSLVADLPQLVASVRTWRSGTPGAVSLATWALACVSAVLWITFGVGAGQWPIVAANAAALANRGGILVLETSARRRAAAA